MRGPRLKKIRRFGTPIPGLTRKSPKEGSHPPGQHGPAQGGRHRKVSEFRRRLEEKQKVRLNYGISERQLRRVFDEAARTAGNTGVVFFSLLERRLSNVVFRAGFAPTEPAARQLVSHGHIHVNGRKVDRASYRVNVGDTVRLSPKAAQNPTVLQNVKRGPEVRLPSYLALDEGGIVARMIAEPMRSDVPFIVDDRSIIEFYAR